MLKGITILLAFFLGGEFIAQLFAWPIPGSVIGMLLLFVFLWRLGSLPPALKSAADSLLPFLPLFIVPASVGIVNHFYLLQQDGWLLVVAMVLSLLLGIPLCGLLMQRLLKVRTKRGAE
ncbi:MAG: CidA/LrgA family protein [Bermanella sp.]